MKGLENIIYSWRERNFNARAKYPEFIHFPGIGNNNDSFFDDHYHLVYVRVWMDKLIDWYNAQPKPWV